MSSVSGEPKKGNIIIPDTNPLIHDPERCISRCQEGGNLVVIPLPVIIELDNLKTKQGTSLEARIVLREINERRQRNDPQLRIEREMLWSKLNLDKDKMDNKIIATLNQVYHQWSRAGKNPYQGYAKIKMVSNDNALAILARELSEEIIVEPYQSERLRREPNLTIPRVKLAKLETNIDSQGGYFNVSRLPSKYRSVREIICEVRPNGKLKKDPRLRDNFIAVRQEGGVMRILDQDMQAYNIRPAHNGHINYEQILAFHYLLDYPTRCVFLQGGAGTGKTLIALACGMEAKQRSSFNRIIIARPTIPLDENSKIGFLPGDTYQKLQPWFSPIFDNMHFLLKKNEKEAAEFEKSILSGQWFDALLKRNIWVQPLDSVRGRSIQNSFVIIEEAQNLTRHQMKTIITRVASSSKIVFTGDLSQIDNREIDASSSGLAYAIENLKDPSVGAVNLRMNLRSRLAEIADELL